MRKLASYTGAIGQRHERYQAASAAQSPRESLERHAYDRTLCTRETIRARAALLQYHCRADSVRCVCNASKYLGTKEYQWYVPSICSFTVKRLSHARMRLHECVVPH